MFINDKVMNVYQQHYFDIMQKLERIHRAVYADSVNGQVKHWGHVGSIGRVSELLDEIILFVGG
jgi:hypothetical protein